jgi:signal transduction histidine kinase/CheY-like chemotaxis protein
MAFYEAMLHRAGDASAEFRAVTAAGGSTWVRETIRVPEAAAADRTIRGVMTDISRRKQLEEQLLRSERFGALHGLASRLAHDLNNPLMIISGYGEELLQSMAPENPMRGDIEQILGASERISGVTEQLLGFTRKLGGEPRPVNVVGLLGGMEERIQAAAGEAVTVELTLVDHPVWTMVDPEQMEDVILAMVSGGREGAQGRSRVTIGCDLDVIAERLPESTLRPGAYARIALHDNGTGMDSGKQAAIFESVLSAKDPESSGEAGAHPTGGLAGAYSMVREWGGDIAFSSEPLRGSTFLIYLPYFRPEPAEVREEAPVEAIAPPETPTPEPTRGTILLVEDEAGIRALVRKILRRERYDVLEAGSGEEALNVAAAHHGRIDLLVSDVMLPGMGGRKLAESMHEWMPSMKVLYVSGYSDDEALRAGSFPPGSRFLQKPFTLSSLVGKVREAIAEENS